MATATTPRRRRASPDRESGDLALDFANSLAVRATGEAGDLLGEYEALVRWSRRRGLTSEREARQLVSRGHASREEAARAQRRAFELQETLFALFSAIAQERPLPADPLARLERLAREASKRRALVPSGGGAAWKPQVEPGELDSMLWPVVEAAALLLTSERVSRLRICDGENCARLFIDNSRRQNRRWCDMAVCGNRAKARRHHARKVQAAGDRIVAPVRRSRRPTRVTEPSPPRTRAAPDKPGDVERPDDSAENEVRRDDGFVWL